MRLAQKGRDSGRRRSVNSVETLCVRGPAMRLKHSALILTAGFLLIPTLTWSQGPGGRDRGDRGNGGGDRGGWGGGPPGGGFDGDRRLDEVFKRLDKNEDGQLDYNEMPETLQGERDKYDLNHDGFIDLNEFKAYVAARRGDGNRDGNNAGGDRRPGGED